MDTTKKCEKTLFETSEFRKDIFDMDYFQIIKLIELNELDFKDNNGDTLLHWASYYNEIHIVKDLLKRGMNINITNIDGTTLFILLVVMII